MLDGNVHVVYRRDDNKLYYTTNASGTWTTGSVEIDGVRIGMPSLGIDGEGKLHAAYWDMSSGYLKYATNASGSWTTVPVDNGGKLEVGAALTLDHNGKVHISYHDYGNDVVKYATNESGS